jgi:hypothetical protein
MSEQIIFDPKIHMLKSDSEANITSRLSKQGAKLATAESERAAVQAQWDGAQHKLSLIDNLQEQVTTLQSDVAQSNTRYARYQAMTAHGITDESIIGGFESEYSKLSGDDVPAYNDWMQSLKDDPSKASTLLRAHIPTGQAPTPIAPPAGSPTPPQSSPPVAPKSNTGVIDHNAAAPSKEELISNQGNAAYYAANIEHFRKL